jgi:hypothetical protein
MEKKEMFLNGFFLPIEIPFILEAIKPIALIAKKRPLIT